MSRIKVTKGQREQLRNCHSGVGFCVYHNGNGNIIEFEFYLDKNNQPRYIKSGKTIEFEVEPEEEASTK